ncbi:MAG: alpha-hydroxy-acid oxidizing protein [Acidimicrobiia bacterium]|nr:alpha-hydroxy-acid oxidizing protein [Acidimicrobiia bacterium]
MTSRRMVLRQLLALFAGSPLVGTRLGAGQEAGTVYPPAYSEEVMRPVNLHEFEQAAQKKIHKLAYDFIAGGAEDEVTLRANREALNRIFLRPRVMVDVSKIDPSVELLGKRMDFPILLAPTGGKNLVIPDGDRIAAQGAAATKTIYVVSGGAWIEKLDRTGGPPLWWQNTTGQSSRSAAESYARRSEDSGCAAICVTVDNPYQSNRERNNRNRFDYGYMQTGVPGDEVSRQKPRSPAVAAMLQPHNPNMTWRYVDWLKGACSLPVVIKGILTAEDASLAVAHGADAIVVSNHGARQLDTVLPTIEALPEVVAAVGAKVPVLMDGGIRRGTDILKALALGAKAILIGRPYVWGLAAFGQVGVQRVVELLSAELVLSMGLAGKPNVASIDRSLVRPAGGL